MAGFAVLPEGSSAKIAANVGGFGALALVVGLFLDLSVVEAVLGGAAVAIGLWLLLYLVDSSCPLLEHRARVTLGGAAFIAGLLVVPAFALDDLFDVIFVCVLSFVLCVGAFWFATGPRNPMPANALMAPSSSERCAQCGRFSRKGSLCAWCGAPRTAAN
jgi:hypothetical protein